MVQTIAKAPVPARPASCCREIDDLYPFLMQCLIRDIFFVTQSPQRERKGAQRCSARPSALLIEKIK